MKWHHPRRPGGHRPGQSRQHGLPPPIECDGQVYHFDTDMYMSAGAVGLDGRPSGVATPSIRKVIASCPERLVLTKQKSAVISFMFVTPADLPPGWPIMPEFAVEAALEALAAGKAVLLLAYSRQALERLVISVAKAL